MNAPVLASASSIRVFVYHQCPAAATGSALGPFGLTSYWWLDGTGVRIVMATGYDERELRPRIEQAIYEALGDPADAVRRRQDALAELPEF